MFSARAMAARDKDIPHQKQQQEQQHAAVQSDNSAPSSSSQDTSDATIATTNVAASVSSPAGKSMFSDMLSENPIFSGGLGLMVFGGTLALLRRGVTAAATTAQRRLLISLEIPSKDRAHPWFLHWMGAQAQAQDLAQRGLLGKPRKETVREFLGLVDPPPRSSTSTNADGIPLHDPLALAEGGSSVSPVRIYSHDLAVETSYTPHAQAEERGQARFSLVPGPGTHWFRYKGVWIRLERERNGKMVDLNTGAPWETVTLTTLFSYSHIFPQLLHEARQLALASTQGKTVIYTSWGPEWRPFGQPRRTRQLGSVVLAPGRKDQIVQDVEAFLERGSWYAERGIPYRRGYLLHGAPGSGKSSFITALAGHLDFNICILNLSERGLTDDKLNHLLSNAPERSILLLEDVDAAFLGRQQTGEDGYQASVTFSGLLNALDGVANGESRIIFMTTNHVERLDPALIRPGRVDVIAELGDAEPAQVEELMRRFYRDTLREPERADADIDELAREFSRAVESEAVRRRATLGLDPSGHAPVLADEGKGFPLRMMPAASGGVSMAELQGLFIRFPDDPRGAIEAFRIENEMRHQHLAQRSRPSPS